MSPGPDPGSIGATRDRITAAVVDPLGALGYDLEAVELTPAGTRRMLRVAVDRDGGVTLDDIAEVTHDVESLTELFKGASVVCNTVGPFSRYGPEVVEACLAAGVHYIDTTGEQDWLITCDEQYGADFASAGLLLSPLIVQWTASERWGARAARAGVFVTDAGQEPSPPVPVVAAG